MSQHKTGGSSAYSYQEQELIQQLVKSRMEQDEQLEFENLDEYEVPPKIHFAMLSKPAVSIKFKEITFNTASIRLFEGVKHILPIVSASKRRIGVIPLAAEEARSVEWARQNKKGEWCNKTIVSLEYVENIFTLMNWNRECRYKAIGRVANSPRGLILIFDLNEAAMFSRESKEYIDPATGEIKKAKVIYYPDAYKGRIGQSYSDYVASQQLSLYDQFSDLTGKTYSDVPDAQSEENL